MTVGGLLSRCILPIECQKTVTGSDPVDDGAENFKQSQRASLMIFKLGDLFLFSNFRTDHCRCADRFQLECLCNDLFQLSTARITHCNDS